MGTNNPDTVVGRSVKEEDKFRLGVVSKPAARNGEAFGRLLMQDRRDGCDVRVLAPRPVEFQDAIGRELRNLFDDVATQPVPDRFLKLLNQLEDNVLHSTRPDGGPGDSE